MTDEAFNRRDAEDLIRTVTDLANLVGRVTVSTTQHAQMFDKHTALIDSLAESVTKLADQQVKMRDQIEELQAKERKHK